VGIHPDRIIPVCAAAFAFGLPGSRLLYALAVEPGRTLAQPLSLFSCGGFAFYGGLVGGAIGVLLVSWLLGVGGWKLLDILAPASILGLGLGRIGCLSAGCCHGAPADLGPGATPLLPDGLLHGQFWLSPHFPFLATEFRPGGVTRPELMGLPLYPTQLWSVFFGVGVGLLLIWMWRHRRFDGQILAMMLLLEPLERFLVETFRADHRGYAISWEADPSWASRLPGLSAAGDEMHAASDTIRIGLTTSQGLGLVMMAIGVLILVLRWNKGVAPEEAVEEED
jgi:phosphatidylglycerol:prolipoprotein diacylglycerol transferase